MVQPASSSQSAGTTDIEALIDALADASRTEIAPAEFHALLIQESVPALAAIGGAIWRRPLQGGWELEAEHSLRNVADIDGDEDVLRAHARLLQAALEADDVREFEPRSAVGPTQNGNLANPFPCLVLLAPMKADGEAVGVIEIFQRPDASPAARLGFQRFLATLAEIAGDYHRTRQLQSFRQRSSAWGRFEEFAEKVHRDLDVDRTAYTVANEGHRVLGADRVSVALKKGRRACRLTAMSGQDHIEHRANAVSKLEALCAAAVKSNDAIWFHENADELPPQVEQLAHNYLDESPARLLAVLPMSLPPDEEFPDRDTSPLGAIVVEKFDADYDGDLLRHRAEGVARHGAAALGNAIRHRSLPFYPVIKGIEKLTWFVRLKQLPKTALVLGAIAAFVCALVFIQKDFTISGEGELQPEFRQDVYAPIRGVVYKVHAQHGKTIAVGEPLVDLRQRELDLQYTTLLGEKHKQAARKASVKASIFTRPTGMSNQEFQLRRQQLTAESEEIDKLLENLDEQLEIVELQRKELQVPSPMTGQVLTWDVGPLLRDRPVERGQVLLTMADVTGPWVLEIRVADHDIGHVLAAQEESEEPLKVSFLLATDPENSFEGRIQKISMATEVDEEQGATALVTVAIDRDKIPLLRPGATVIPKIECGRRALGYVWFHDLWDSVRTWILF